jgi:hypothetical protein
MRYYVLLLLLIIFASSVVWAQEAIDPNEPVTGTLTENQHTAEYQFKGEAGSTVSISLSSRAFDAYVTLQDEDGTEVSSNDDSNGSLDAFLEITLPRDETYTIVVSSAGDSGTGDYELTLSYLAIQTIEYGEIVQGEISEDMPRVQYRFEGQEGDNILLSLTSPTFDTFLHLSDSSNFDLVTDDDGGDGTNSMIAGYELPETGTYFVTARSYSEVGSGEFTLQIYPIEVIPLDVNSTVEGELSGNTAIYAIEVTAGDIIDVDVVGSDGLDTTLLLRGSNGFIVTTDDDSGEDLNPEVRDWLIEEYGTFNVIVQPVDTTATGSYELTYAVHEPQALTCATTETLHFTPKHQHAIFSITPEADAEYTFTLTSEDANTTSLYVRAFQDSGIVAFDSSEVGEVNSSYLYIPESESEIRLLISDYNYNVETFSLELSCG